MRVWNKKTHHFVVKFENKTGPILRIIIEISGKKTEIYTITTVSGKQRIR
jgi:hypothetical protein